MTTASQNPVDIFNQFVQQINKAKSSIFCGPECQKVQREEALRRAYDAAKTAVARDPANVQRTYKDLYTYKHGPAAYDDHMEQTYRAAAQKMVATFQARADAAVDRITADLESSYAAARANLDNIAPAATQYRSTNRQIRQDIRQTRSDVITNERKTAYEAEGVAWLQSIRVWLYVLYAVAAISCITLLWGRSAPMGLKLGGTLLAVVFPFIMIPLMRSGRDTFTWIVGLFPTNMYQHIAD